MRALLAVTLRMSRRRQQQLHSARSLRRCSIQYFPAHLLTQWVASQLVLAYCQKALIGRCLAAQAGHRNRTAGRQKYPANYGGLWRIPGQNRARRGAQERRISATATWGSVLV